MKSATRTYVQSQRASSTQATRERLLTAAEAAFTAAVYEDVTLAAVAKEAGVSHQTLLNHFESKEGLFNAVIEGLKEQIVDRRSEVEPGSVARVIDYLMSQYEEMGDVNARYAMTAERFPLVAEAMRFGRDSHREWLELQLAPAPAAPQARAGAGAERAPRGDGRLHLEAAPPGHRAVPGRDGCHHDHARRGRPARRRRNTGR